MGNLLIGVSAALMLGASNAVLAKSTSCSDVVSAFDWEDRNAARKYDDEIRITMEAIDEGFVTRGKRSVIKPLSDEGFTKIRMTAVENCRANPGQTLVRSAHDMYEGLRSMQETTLGK